jgi:release factor glutamine methyltransferase
MFVSDNSLQSAKKYFYERLEAQFSTTELKSMWTQIICRRMNWTPTDLMLHQGSRLSESDLLFVRSFVKGLLNQEPFQYLMGETSFFGLKILCDERALIPRPETEELVAWVSEEVENPQLIIDLCTGTGCIALALKSVFPSAEVEALDVSQEALALCQENARNLGLAISTKKEDLLDVSDEFMSSGKAYDVIISNPPYIPNHEKSLMNANVLQHEPSLALFVDDSNPILFYKIITQWADQHLRQGGFLFFELHEAYSQEVLDFMGGFSFHNVEIRRDLQGKLRMMKAQKV